jgi:hypothetical protein
MVTVAPVGAVVVGAVVVGAVVVGAVVVGAVVVGAVVVGVGDGQPKAPINKPSTTIKLTAIQIDFFLIILPFSSFLNFIFLFWPIILLVVSIFIY